MKMYKHVLRTIPVVALGLMLSAPANAFGWFFWRHHNFDVIEYEMKGRRTPTHYF